ncbi:hypothetical protein J5N97_005946 [Dioscorea zingiberensis]|uniref:Heat stress transcription factor A-8 n=1 Tax=Dioscorea zingiberensis TaxID=325984 RepID=A0A9D5D929_9LILI|nr:hypothetical protein J5N97_005946 [Dioscorea zingiberensis]
MTIFPASSVSSTPTQGFHKADHDRWEFANEGFVKGQKHLLKTIIRRKPGQDHPQLQQSQAKNATLNACVEVGKFGLEEEVERLKRDKDLLRQELIKLRHHQQNTENQVHDLRQSLQVMEQNQQQMLSFLAMAVENPRLLPQLMMQQNPNNRRRTDINKKRRLPALEHKVYNGVDAPSGGEIVRYQPPVDEAMKPLLKPVLSPDELTTSVPMPIDFDGLLADMDAMSAGSDSSVPSEEDGCDTEFFSKYLENLLAGEKPEDNDQVDPQKMETTDSIMDFDFLKQDQLDGPLNLETQRSDLKVEDTKMRG